MKIAETYNIEVLVLLCKPSILTFQLNLFYDAYHGNLIFHQLLNFMLQSAAKYDAEDAGGIHVTTVMFLENKV